MEYSRKLPSSRLKVKGGAKNFTFFLGDMGPLRKCVFLFEENGSAVIFEGFNIRFKSHGDILLGAKNPMRAKTILFSSQVQVAISAQKNANLADESSY